MQHNQQPEDVVKRVDERSSRHITQLRWFRRAGSDQTISSLGEYFLPYFLAAIEACWLNGVLIGLASLNFLDANSALLPFWGPLLLFVSAIWLFRHALQNESSSQGGNAPAEEDKPQSLPGLRLMFGVIGLLTIGLIWLRVYSSSNFLFDPGWLLAFVGDMLALNWHFYQALFIAAGAIYLCWRSMSITQLTIEPGHVFRQIWVGLLVFLVAILFRANHASTGSNVDDVVLLLSIPIFLYLSLSTHALARVAFIRRDHPFGLEGNVMAQEKAMLSVIGIVGLVLLVFTVIGGSAFSPAFFNALHPIWYGLTVVYGWLVTLFSEFAVIIVTPFLWLANWWFSHFPNKFPTIHQPTTNAKNPRHLLQINTSSPAIVFSIRILLPLLILLVLIILVRLALRRRKRLKISLNRLSGDIRESIWSWGLFWGQLRGFLRAFFQRIFPKQASSEEKERQLEEISAPPTARTIREIYRALLKKAAQRGQIRKRDETPYEFQRRLDERDPQNEPQLGLLTEAYALTRYGGGVPNEREVDTIRQFWNELEQKWEASS